MSVCVRVCVCHRQTGNRPLVSIIHKPGCLVEKTVPEPAGPGLEAAVPLARRQQLKQSVVGVAGIFDNPVFTDTPSLVNVLDGGMLTGRLQRTVCAAHSIEN